MKKYLLLLLIIVMFLSVAGCNNEISEEERIRMQEVNDKALYSDIMVFNGTTRFGILPNPPSRRFNEVFIVHTEEEASRFPDEVLVDMSDILVTWPSFRTPHIVDEMNQYIINNEIDMEEFSLQYPLTVECLVDNWENVFNFWNTGIDRSWRGFIRGNVARISCDVVINWPSPDDDDFPRWQELNRRRGYFVNMHFRGNMPFVQLSSPTLNHIYGIVFVHNEEEDVGFPEGVFAAWPTVRTQLIAENMNAYINENEIDLAQFSLQYPLTIEDFVDNWEQVLDFWNNGLSQSGRSSVQRLPRLTE